MKLHNFAKLLCKLEGGKKQVNIAQIKEIMKIINKLSLGRFYKEIHKWVR